MIFDRSSKFFLIFLYKTRSSTIMSHPDHFFSWGLLVETKFISTNRLGCDNSCSFLMSAKKHQTCSLAQCQLRSFHYFLNDFKEAVPHDIPVVMVEKRSYAICSWCCVENGVKQDLFQLIFAPSLTNANLFLL